ncbi:MAG: hypothetical protein BHW64_02970 [Candidatus Melainabacteria bacterium LEY3_CP_29_8]|nr:MAG: hypothetical protein BHW64_02970 [Candidatus Melainabacteria bacterium LEY3_CP_29_8]
MPTFGTGVDTYKVSNPKNKKDENAKRKRNLIIFGTLVTTAAVALGALYFSGKKVNKTKLTENLPEVKDNNISISKFNDDLKNSSIPYETLAKNIVDMNNLLKSENLNEESFGNIVECIGKHYQKLISSKCPNKEKIILYEEYYQFLNLYFKNSSISNKLQEILAQKSSLELSETNINEDSKLLQNVLQDEKKDFLHKRILIISLFKKYKDNKDDITKLADIINKHADLNKLNKNKEEYQKKLSLLFNTYNASDDTIKNNSNDIIQHILNSKYQFIYPEDSLYYYDDIEPKNIFSNVKNTKAYNTFDSIKADLLSRLGVSRESMLTEVVNNINNPNIKAITLDDSYNKWNCLRFKVDENNYIYYNIDIFNNTMTRLNFTIESKNDNENLFNYQGNVVKKKDIPILFEKEFNKK